MRILSRTTLILLAVFAAIIPTAHAQMEPVVTKRSTFRIPFAFDAAEYEQIGAQEVQLFVSRDGGQTWKHSQSALPSAKRFRFHALQDGQYQFAVRTVDRNQQLHPAGPLTPGLIVKVDASRPIAALDVTETGQQTAQVKWECRDDNLDLTSLRLEYRDARSANWSGVPINRPSGTTKIPLTSGEQTSFRLVAKDTAGNEAIAERSLRARASTVAAIPTVSPGKIAAIPTVNPGKNRTTQLVSMDSTAPGLAFPKTALTSAPALPNARPATTAVRPVAAARSQDVLGPFDLPSSAITRQSRPPVQNQTTAPSLVEHRVVDPTMPRMVNKLQFSLDYGLDDVGPSGLGSVEVYITEDGGQKWWRYGADRDKKSPVVLRVPRDGTYGFVIAARSGAGLGDTPPMPGDTPQATVIVDRTSPRARFDQLQMSDDGRTLLVRWVAEDPNPHDRPIRIEYSQTKAGPWTPMTDWQDNTGKLDWQVSRNVPTQVYIRMLVRDAAGNAGQLVYPQPVLVDMSRPRARITSIKVSAE